MKNCKPGPLNMADGGIVPKPVSPFSLRGMYNTVAGAADSVTARFRPPPGYLEQEAAIARQQAASAPVVVAPVQPVAPPPAVPQIGGMNNAIQNASRRAMGLRNGGIVPGKRNGNKDTVPIMATPDEAVLPVDTVDALGGPDAVQDIIDATHTPVKEQGLRGYANGTGSIEDDLLRPAGGFMPATRATLRESGADISRAANRGNYGEAAGHLVRGAITTPLAAGADFFNAVPGAQSAYRAIEGAVSDVTNGVSSNGIRKSASDFGSTILTGSTANATPAPTAPTVTPNPTDTRLQTGAQTTPMNPGLRNTVPGVTRDGNSFSNTDAQGPSVIPAPDQTAMAREQRAAAIKAETDKMRMGLRDYGDANYYTTGAGANGGAQATVLRNPSFFRQEEPGVASPSLSTLDRRDLSANQRAVLDQRERETTMNNETARLVNERNVNMGLRGQDLTYDSARERDQIMARGQDMDARGRVAKALQDQANSDRQYELEKQKFGETKAKERFDQRLKSTEEVSKRVSAMIPPGADGKPDVAGQARAMESLNAMLSNRQTRLQQELTKNPGNKAAAAELEAIESQGPGVFTEQQLRQLIVGQRAAGVADKAGFIGSAVNSTAPVTSLRRKEGILWDDYETDRGDRIPSWRIDGLPWERSNPDFNILKR